MEKAAIPVAALQMLRTASRNDLPLILALLARANDTPYDLAAVAEEKCFGAGIAGEPVVRLFGDKGIAVTCGKWLRILAVGRDARGRGIGTRLLEDSGATVIGAEPGNYFTPGVLEAQRSFFEKRGCRETASTWNLHCGTGCHVPSLTTRPVGRVQHATHWRGPALDGSLRVRLGFSEFRLRVAP
jgi:GNAT superfamily N-acetyltransferase